MLNVPVIEGKFGARLVGLYRFKSGVIDRIDPDILTLPADDDPDPTVGNDPDLANETFKDRDIDEEKTHGGRIALKWSATDDLEVATTFWAQRTEMGGLQERDSSFGDRLRTTRLLPDPFWSTFVNSNLTLAYRLPFSANVLVSANKFTRAFSETLDTTEFVRGIFGQTVPTPLDTTGDSDEYSVEARVTSDLGGSLEYIIGAYYLDKDRQFNQLLIANGLSDVLGIPIANDLLLSFNQTVREEEKALFGQLSYQIRDKLTLTLGLRWFDYENTNQGTRVGLFGANPLDVIAQEDDINPKFTVSYKIDEDKMIFATASQGFRPGFGINVFFPPSCDQDLLDLNIDPANLPTQTNADTLWNYDIGFKSATANNRLILNATAYYLDWTDIQQRITLPTCGFFLTGNAGEASSKGVELELYSQPFANVDLTATVGYVDAKLENDAVELGGQQGDRLTNVPELTFATMLRYNFVVGSNYDASIQAEYQHTGNSHVSFNFANPLDEKPAFEILNLRFRVRLNEWEGHLFVENVLDERAALSISGFGTAPNVRRVGTNDPRTIGLRISRQF
jgi:outer membrane receptor protein involved in Fe transport